MQRLSPGSAAIMDGVVRVVPYSGQRHPVGRDPLVAFEDDVARIFIGLPVRGMGTI
jgi:hypothetical protein